MKTIRKHDQVTDVNYAKHLIESEQEARQSLFDQTSVKSSQVTEVQNGYKIVVRTGKHWGSSDVEFIANDFSEALDVQMNYHRELREIREAGLNNLYRRVEEARELLSRLGENPEEDEVPFVVSSDEETYGEEVTYKSASNDGDFEEEVITTRRVRRPASNTHRR